MTSTDSFNTHYRTCNLCEAMCGIEIQHKNGEITGIRGDKDDPFSRGHICPKAVALQDIYLDKDRLKRPVRRIENGWKQIEWEEAFDEVAGKLKQIQAQYGKNSVATYYGNPTVHNYGSLLFGPLFNHSLRTRRRFSATSVDQLAHHCASYFLYGHQLLLPVPDLDRAKFLLILGANPAVSNGSLMTAPDVANRLKSIRARGGKIVLIDPRHTETAKLADQHFFIRPGTDVFLLLAILQVIFSEGLAKPGRLAEFIDGIDTIRQGVAEFVPERVTAVTGMDAESIRLLAREFATTEPSVCYGRIGVSTQEFGAICQWLIQVINIVTGNLDRAGGALFTKPAFDAVNAPRKVAPKGSLGRWHSSVRKLPEFAGELPVAALSEEILNPGADQIRGLVTSAGNPVLSTPNGRRLEEALSQLDFMVSIDFYINETTRHAHIILPPTSALEHDHYDLAFHLLAIRNTAKYSTALYEPLKDQRHDWQILLELQSRIESKSVWSSWKSAIKKWILMRMGPAGLLDLGLRFGPYGSGMNPFGRGLSVSKLKAAPHGIDLGALEPCLPQRLATTDKRIALAPDVLVKDLQRVRDRLNGETLRPQEYDFLLIGRRQLRSNNSWMHNSLRMVKGRNPCTLLMNPADAERFQITNGQPVSVSSRVGSIELPVEFSAEMMQGVVSIPHGWGHHRPGIAMEVAQQHAGASINDLTDELAIDQLVGTAAFNGIPVSVKRKA